MAQLTFTISDAQFSRVLDAYCVNYTGTDRAQFTRRQIMDWIIANVKAHEERVAMEAAATSVPAPVTVT